MRLRRLIEEPDPAAVANRGRNRLRPDERFTEWAPVRAAAWQVLDGVVSPGARVAVGGAGNGDDLPLEELSARALRVDLLDLDPKAAARGRNRLPLKDRVEVHACDLTGGAAGAVARAALQTRPVGPVLVEPAPLPGGPHDVVIADLFYTQLLYPALKDARLPTVKEQRLMARAGQGLVDGVVARLHAQAPVVVHLTDILGWWPGHPQPFTLDEVLAATPADAQALIARGNRPRGCDVPAAIARAGASVRRRSLYRWQFNATTDYLVEAIVATSDG